MLPLSRILEYGNHAPIRPKVSYNFSSGTAVNQGQISGVLSGLNYFPIPNSAGLYGVYGSAAILTLPANVTIGLSDYSLEARYYLNSNSSEYSVVCAFGNLGIRYGDNGFADRLQAASTFNTLPTCYTTQYTRSVTYRNIVKFKIERIANVTKLYYNGVQINFSTGLSTSYTYSQISDTVNVVAYDKITLGSSSLALIDFSFNF